MHILYTWWHIVNVNYVRSCIFYGFLWKRKARAFKKTFVAGYRYLFIYLFIYFVIFFLISVNSSKPGDCGGKKKFISFNCPFFSEGCVRVIPYYSERRIVFHCFYLSLFFSFLYFNRFHPRIIKLFLSYFRGRALIIIFINI